MRLKFLLIFSLLVSIDVHAVISGWQDVDIVKGRIILDVEIARVPTKALLDSGATGINVSTVFLEENNISYVKGRQYTAIGAHGETRAHEIKDLDITIFGRQFPFKNLHTFESNRNYQVLLGLPFLKLTVIQIDYPNSRVRFFSRDSVDLKGQANVDLKHGRQQSKLVTSIELKGDEKIDLLFDTGSTAGIVIDRAFAKKRAWLEKYRIGQVKVSGIAETISADQLQIPYLKLGPYELENVKVVVPQDKNASTNYEQKSVKQNQTRRKSKESGYAGILGGDVLKHFVVTLDAKNALMHINAPHPDFSETSPLQQE